MIIGFTGTQEGMTREQAGTVFDIFLSHQPTLFVHGDCIGADAQAHVLARALNINVRMRPCDITSKRARSQGAMETYPVKKPLDRNKDIVADADLMVACPKGFSEELRSGTWATIREARRKRKKLIIVYPDGSVG